MAYTPTTWTTGDTITASAMNKIENGIADAGGSVATVEIRYEGTGTLSCMCLVGATEGIPSGRSHYSLLSGSTQYGTGGYCPVQLIPVPIPSSSLQAVIVFDDYIETNYDIACVGKTLQDFREKIGATVWNSIPLYGFIITGDTTITITPK